MESESNYSGHLFTGDSLSYHNNQQFSARDRDNDEWSDNCAEFKHGRFWHHDCDKANLNGKYLRNGVIIWHGVTWLSWKNTWYSMKRAEMKIKPT